MFRSILNRHKIIRRFGRRIHTARAAISILSSEEEKSNRDFSWNGRVENPFAARGAAVKYLKIKIGFLIGCVAAIIILLLYHPFFRITLISISGNQRVKKEDLQKTAEGIIFYKKWFILPQNSFIFANVEEIKDIMKKRFPIESIVVTKTFPNAISVAVQEEIPSMIFGNGKQFAYIDNSGKVIEVVRNVMNYEWIETVKHTTSTASDGLATTNAEVISRVHKPDIRQLQSQFGAYPVVYDKVGKNETVNEIVMTEKIATNILDWVGALKSRSDIPLNYIVLDGEIGEMVIKTKEGWEIRTRADVEVKEQFENLLLILREKINNRRNLSYIDARPDGRFYWQ
ncbi:MAG: FtsQ-type POTRA domain-containing protein [Patescibacteria group bacterium]